MNEENGNENQIVIVNTKKRSIIVVNWQQSKEKINRHTLKERTEEKSTFFSKKKKFSCKCVFESACVLAKKLDR